MVCHWGVFEKQWQRCIGHWGKGEIITFGIWIEWQDKAWKNVTNQKWLKSNKCWQEWDSNPCLSVSPGHTPPCAYHSPFRNQTRRLFISSNNHTPLTLEQVRLCRGRLEAWVDSKFHTNQSPMPILTASFDHLISLPSSFSRISRADAKWLYSSPPRR